MLYVEAALFGFWFGSGLFGSSFIWDLIGQPDSPRRTMFKRAWFVWCVLGILYCAWHLMPFRLDARQYHEQRQDADIERLQEDIMRLSRRELH